jgi:predicted ArsR family transcriptional regulator
MDSPSAPGQDVPSQFVSVFLEVLNDLTGEHGARAVLRRAALGDWIDQPPAASLSDRIAMGRVSDLMAALEDVYGTRGGRALARRLGSALMDRYLKDIGALGGLGNAAFQALPARARARLGLGALRRVLSQMETMAAELKVSQDNLVLSMGSCPFCAGRSLDGPACTPLQGLVDAVLRAAVPELPWVSEETSCRAARAGSCDVMVRLPRPTM